MNKVCSLMVIFLFIIYSVPVAAQTTKPLKFNLNKDSTSFIKLNLSSQFWLRYSENNPGTLIDGERRSNFSDVSIRRYRISAYGVINNKTSIVFSLGENNINQTIEGPGIQLLDLYIDYKISEKFSLGTGKSVWNGLSRLSTPSSSTVLGLDVPLFALPTINISDNILRKLSVFTKGQIKNIDYRFVVSRPLNNIKTDTSVVDNKVGFSTLKPKFQTSGYLKYQFFGHESQNSPFNVGNYLGTKKVLSLGAGFEFQPKALWSLGEQSDTIFNNLKLFAIDLFGSLPTSEKQSITFYLGYFNYDFGRNYIRNIGANNVASGVTSGSFNGSGNKHPTIGTGNTYYIQTGYLFEFKNEFENFKKGLQPFFSVQISDYEALSDRMIFVESGINYLLNGHYSKLTLALQNRPIFYESGEDVRLSARRNLFVLQYQIKI